MIMNLFIGVLIIIFATINLIRMTALLVGSNYYEIVMHLRSKKRVSAQKPFYSVIIPAYNEGVSIHRSLASLVGQDYPKSLYEVIVVNDGSKDDTAKRVDEFIANNPGTMITLVNQENGGKANALNNGIRNYARGELVMCLDADSALHPQALSNAVKYFEDTRVMGLSANVKILPGDGLLNLTQQFEYLVCYQMKRAQAIYNAEYIIGGVGSSFRKSFLEKVQYYDTDTITEDIDLTLKILSQGNKRYRVMYGSDVIAYTESVHNLKDLITQRFRWKWGRCQTFLKNRNLFFNKDKRFGKLLTFFSLPFAVYGDIAFLFEPLLIGYVMFLVIAYQDITTLLSAMFILITYIIFNIVSENTITIRQKALFTFLAPTMYVLFYILAYAEYLALIKAIIKLPRLRQSIESRECHWEHVQRMPVTSTISH